MKKMIFTLLMVGWLPGLGMGQVVDTVGVESRVDSLVSLNLDLTAQQQFEDALHAIYSAEKIALDAFGRSSAELGKCKHVHALTLHSWGKLEEAEALYLEALDIRAKALGTMHPDYAKSLHNLAFLYTDKGEYWEAEKKYLEAKEIREKTLGKEHRDYAQTVNNLALVYQVMGDYTKSEPLYIESMEIRAKILGKNHPDYAQSLGNLGDFYSNKGEYNIAEKMYLECKIINAKTLGREDPEYALGLIGLAIVYAKKGDYDKSELLFLETKEIWAKTLGREHPYYAASLNNLAILYQEKGDYAKSEILSLEAKDIQAKVQGREHPYYANSVSNLANIYSLKGEYSKADLFFGEAKDIIEKIMGREHPEYATCLNNMASSYFLRGDYTKAELLFLEAKEVRAKLLTRDHPDYALTLNNLSALYRGLQDYVKAEQMSLEAAEIWVKTLGKEHPYFAENLNNLAKIYWETNSVSKATQTLLELNDLDIFLISQSVDYSSESQMLAYLHTFINKTAQFQSFLNDNPKSELSRATFDNALFFKGYLQENARRLARSIESADSVTRETYERWQGCRRRLANEYARPIAERRYVGEMETEADGYEKILTRNLATFGETRHAPQWQKVQAALHPGEVAVEFIHYQYFNPKPTDSTLYAALILRPNWPAPRMIPLFEQRQIQPLLAAANTATTAGHIYANTGDLQQQRSRAGQKKNPSRGEREEGIVIPGTQTASLYQLIWAPIDSLLQGASTIYYAPSGLLHRLQLNAIAVPNTNQTLADKYALVQLGSTRQLVPHSQTNTSTIQTATLFGGLKYDLENPVEMPDSVVQARPAYDVAALRSMLGGTNKNDWTYLPGTEKEVKGIAKTLSQASYSVRTLSGSDGSEDAFKMMGKAGNPAPRVLHIATHGFFFPDPKDTTQLLRAFSDREPVFKTSDNPLLRSGLVLAGANPAWAGGKTPEGQEDGILTAYEISQMNLTGTELVVLSACETGLGDVEDSEGVYGLKRAFKIAGAKYVIMSLWQVPDKQTQELMTIFYKNWLNRNMDIPRAFASAQKSMRKRYADPFYWAGFVLVE